MSHAVESMMYVGATPWHGLGTKLDNPPTVRDAIVAAGLDWKVGKVPLLRQDSYATVPMFATIRESDGSYLGTVGPSYKPLQNNDAFEWFQPFLTSGDASLEAAGSLHEGRHVWILAKLNRDPQVVTGSDSVEPYLLLSNAHDGSRVVSTGFTAIRVVCQNTLNAAHAKGASRLLRIRHTQNLDLAMREVRDTVDVVNRQFTASIEQMRTLARHGCNAEDLRKYVHRVFRSKDADITETAADTALRSDRLFDAIEPLFRAGRGNSGQTYWDAFNGITEYLSWERGRTADNRMTSLWMGDGGALADKALTEALAMVPA
jgi:phage/plasmid-like protein (TIGR03299 family)